MEREISFVDLPEIAVIGKEGFCTKEAQQAPALWQEANVHFPEIAPLVMLEADGTPVGFWGAMTDETRSWLPWTEDFSRGYYLAGAEVYADSTAPEGWTKWVMPARKYLKFGITDGDYAGSFSAGLKELVDRGLKLAGAVCEYTCPRDGKNYYFYPYEE